MIMHSLWFINKRDKHDCGPIKDGDSGWTQIEELAESHNSEFFTHAYTIATLFPFLWILLVYTATLGTLKGNEADIYKQYSIDKTEEN
jgi:hypothetical protein